MEHDTPPQGDMPDDGGFHTPRRDSLAWRMLFWILLISSAVTAALIGTQLQREFSADASRLQARLDAIEHVDVPSLSQSLWDVDIPQIRIQLRGIVSDEDVVFARVVPDDVDDPIGIGSSLLEGNLRTFPLVHARSGEQLGRLEVTWTERRMWERLWGRVLWIVLGQLLKTAIVSLAIVLIFLDFVGRPLGDLAAYARQVNLEDIPGPPPRRRGIFPFLSARYAARTEVNDEIGEVVRGLSEMRRRLLAQISRMRSNRDASQRFVPEAFLELVGAHGAAGAERTVVRTVQRGVLYADVRGFTAWAERRSAEDVFAFLNEHLRWIEGIIASNGGFVHEHRGDAVLALFPTADKAIDAAADLVLKSVAPGPGEDRPGPLSVGVHHGRLLAGLVGGGPQLAASVLGDAVNTAVRLETLTRRYETAVLVTDAARSAAKDPSRWALRRLDRVAIPGRTSAIEIYDIADHLPEPVRKRFEVAVEAYLDGRFASARDGFAAVLKRAPDDAVAQRYRALCERRAGDEASDWAGVTPWDGV